MTGLLRVDHAVHAGRLSLAQVEPGARLVFARAAILGGSAAGIGTASHLVGDGRLPGVVAMAVLFAAAVSMAGVLVLTRATRTRIIVSLVGGQALMHVVLASLGGHRGTPVAEGGFWAHQISHLTAAGPAMVMAHTLGAVLLGLFLAYGEQRLWRLLLTGVLRRHHTRVLVRHLLGLVASHVVPLRATPATGRPRFSLTPARERPRSLWRGPPSPRTVPA